jgi:hypothetical protein
MFRRVLALMTVAALCGCDRLTAPEPIAHPASLSGASYAKAQTTKTNNSTETTFPPMTACDGDVVVFRGSAHTVTTVTVTGAIAHVDQHFNTQDVFGVGASGIVYRLAEIYKVDEDMNLQSAHAEEDFKGQIRAISRGDTDNMLIDAIYHIAFDVSPAGQPMNLRTTVVKMNARCRG